MVRLFSFKSNRRQRQNNGPTSLPLRTKTSDTIPVLRFASTADVAVAAGAAEGFEAVDHVAREEEVAAAVQQRSFSSTPPRTGRRHRLQEAEAVGPLQLRSAVVVVVEGLHRSAEAISSSSSSKLTTALRVRAAVQVTSRAAPHASSVISHCRPREQEQG